MIGQKIKMILSVVAATAVGFLLLGATYIILPNKKPGLPNGTPSPYMLNQIFEAALWMGVTISIAIAFVGLFLLINRVRPKKTGAVPKIQASHSKQSVCLLNFNSCSGFFQ